jgi:hypothetical protein
MEINRNGFDDVCRFGPGGDFAWSWPSGQGIAGLAGNNKLSRVLTKLNGIMTAAISEASGRKYIEMDSDTIIVQEVKDECGKGSFEGAFDATADRTARRDSEISEEPLLFADDSGAGRAVRNKPKHNIRAHRRAAKKRVSLGAIEQGTLFGAFAEGVQTAQADR